MTLQIVFSNQTETLANHLLNGLAAVPADPFAAQHVVVPSTAMARYLQLAIARDRGVCANVKFSFLAHWLWQLAREVDAGVPERSPVDPATMTWMILRILGDSRYAAYPRLGGFLKEADDLMRFELAQSVARVFDQYATYRPDWLAAWRAGKSLSGLRASASGADDEAWQGEIWRAVANDLNLGAAHPLQTILEDIGRKGPGAATVELGQSAAVFAVPVIPPLYLKTICRLSEVMNITLYLMNPCREYWFNIVP
ncbi:MAG: exodeoxyribonuclease V subunit gamma, partial [Smithellaceae bacterium]